MSKDYLRFIFNTSTLLLLLFFINSCKKDDKNIIKIAGKVLDPNTNAYVSGAKVFLYASKLQSGGIFSSGYEEISVMTTDLEGNFVTEFKEEKFSGYKIYISKQNFFSFSKELTTEDIVPGTVFSPVFNLYPECYIKLMIKNIAPADSNDHVIYWFSSGWNACYECCDNTYYHGYGMNFSDTIHCKTYGNQNVTVTYNVTKTGNTTINTMTHFCPAFDTTEFGIYY